MRYLSGIGLGLGLVFSCLFLALLLELYYMFCWKKRIVFRRQQQQQQQQQQEQIAHDDEEEEDDEDKLSSGCSSSAREFLNMFCCKKVSSVNSCAALNPHQICASVRTHQQKQQLSSNNDNVVLKSEDGFLCPPTYLFTIIEETKEDLESDYDDGHVSKPVKSRNGSTSLHELLLLSQTPLSSPTFMIHDNSSSSSSSSQSPHQGYNPFLESSSDSEISKIKPSPPPKFPFLEAAEEKFHERKMMEEQQHSKAPTFSQDSFITIFIGDHNNGRAQ